MSYKTDLQNNNSEFQSNNIDLQAILDTVNSLPESLDTSDATATAADIIENKTAYVNGVKIIGALNVPVTYVGSFEVQGSLKTFGGASRAIASISSVDNLIGKLETGKRYMLILQGVGTVNYSSNCTIYGVAQMYMTSNTVSIDAFEFPDRFSIIGYSSDGVTHTHGANDTYLQMYVDGSTYIHVMNTAGYEGYLSYGYSSFNNPPTIDIYEM